MAEIPKRRSFAPWATLSYLVFGLLWITLSDRVVALVAGESITQMQKLQLFKGYAFVALTALLVFGLIAAHERALARAHQAVAHGRERYERMFAAAHHLVVSLDETLKVIDWNTAAGRILGWDQGPAAPGSFVEAAVPGDWRAAFTQRLRSLLQGQPFEAWECPVVTPSGETSSVIWHAYAIRSVNGTGQELVVLGRDATEVRRLEARLHAAEKIEAIGLLAAGVAHDFNNILTVIVGNVELCQQALGKTDAERAELSRSLEQIDTAARRAAVLTRQLLGLTRRAPAEGETTDPRPLLREMQTMLARVLPENIHLQIEIAPDVWAIRADPAQVEQMLLNLAVNARDAMPAGGTLKVSAANVTAPAANAPRGTSPGRYVRLCVSDTGTGMDAATCARIFEPFFTTKPHGKGTGLGLTSVRRTLEHVQGFIHVESTPGVGSAFEIWLPAAPQVTRPPAPAPALAPAAASARKTVLVCEDDPGIREIVERALLQRGYRVLAASHATQALQLAAEARRPLALLLTDVILPRMSGMQLLRTLRQRGVSVERVLFISGYSGDVLNDVDLTDPAVAFLAKPFAPRTLLARVQELLEAAPSVTAD